MFLLKKLIRLLQVQIMIRKMQSISSIETYSYRMRKDLVSEKEELKCNNIIKQYKTDYLWWYCKRKHKKHYPKWSQTPDHPYKILIIGGPGSGKTNSLFNLINQQPDIHKIYS